MTQGQTTERIGYKNPPLATRWKPGQSGNPGRKRKKRSESIAGLIDKYFSTEIDITINGLSSHASLFEVIVMQLWAQTAAGNKRAMNVLLSYLEFSSAGGERELVVIRKYSEATRKMMAELGLENEDK
jgi:hypothetical protein